MIHGYARQLGGALILESEVGVGTRAHLWLPAGKSEPRVEIAQAVPETLPGVTPQTILAVDDDVLVLMNTAALLEDLGHSAIEANSGLEALTLLDRHPEIDLLVTDQAMPGMTGSQLIAAVRQHRPDLPVILASGYGETPADGMEGIIRLGKPFNQRDLQQALGVALS